MFLIYLSSFKYFGLYFIINIYFYLLTYDEVLNLFSKIINEKILPFSIISEIKRIFLQFLIKK